MNTAQRRQTAASPFWWLRLTSSGWNLPQTTLEQRERTRRSQLAAWIILALLVVDAALLPFALNDPIALSAGVVVGSGLLLAIYLNRRGFVHRAALLMLALISVGALSSLAGQSGKLTLAALPVYDVLTITVIVAALALPRWSAFAAAAANIGLICLDFWLQPHAGDVQQQLQSYPSIFTGALALLARPIVLQVVLATAAYLWARRTDAALARAERAEELAAMEHELAEQRRQLERGLQEMLDTLARVANGQPGARVPAYRDNLLWQMASALNNLLSRLQRASLAEQEFYRTQEEIGRLVEALADIQAGRVARWPAPSGTPIDLLIERIAGSRYRIGPLPSLTTQLTVLPAQYASKKTSL